MSDLSMKSKHCNRARSSGLRILAAGLLPLLRLRSFCQGDDTLIEITPDLYPDKYRFWCNVHASSSKGEEITLSAGAHLFQLGGK